MLPLLCLALRPSSQVLSSPAPVFVDVTDQVGLNFHHFSGAAGEFYMPEIMGSGCALFDYDGDGDLDVFLVQGTLLDPGRGTQALLFPRQPSQPVGHRLFRNDLHPTGKLRFTDVTARSGLGRESYGMGAAVGDYDNDGDLDLYVTSFGPNFLYRNNGDGTFTDVTGQAGVDDPRWSASAAFLDYDHDGDLDLFLTNYVDFTVRGSKKCYAPTGERDYCTPAIYHPVPDRLFRNEGKGKFTDVTQAAGTGRAYGPGLGVICADFNGDGRVDIYVANDGAANLLWINQGNGTFEETALLAGTAYSGEGVPQAGMGVTAADFDNDGDEDLLVTNLRQEGSVLYRNEGRGLFYDATAEGRLLGPSFLFTGFGVGWFDYDGDGRLDLFAANGAVTIIPGLSGDPYPYHQRNQLFRRQGERFEDTTSAAGKALEPSEVSRGAAFGDIDNDGDVDILVTNNNGPARLLLNQVGAKRAWLQVRLEGVRDNREGIGARVGVFRKGKPPLWRRAHRDGSYLSAGDAGVHFGLGAEAEVEAVEVQWPDGTRERWLDVRPNTRLTLRQGSGKDTNPTN